jgi:hypothetical protein
VSPEEIAVADQAQAATAEGNAFLGTLAGVTSAVPVRSGPVTMGFWRELAARLTSGDITTCPHTDLASPLAVFWAPYLPGLIACGPCHEKAVIPEGLQIVASSVPVQESAAVPGAMWGPVLLHFGLCTACTAIDQADPS